MTRDKPTNITLPHPMARPCVIGICGPEGSGKDTTAERLLPWFRQHYPSADITSFAEPLYQAASAITGVPVDVLRRQGYKDTIWTAETAPVLTLIGWHPRRVLRDVGMWVRDHISTAHWAALLNKRAQNNGWWLVTDVRMVSEVPSCTVVIEVRRKGVEYRNDHPTATRLPEKLIDETIWLTPDMDYVALGQLITRIVADRQRFTELVAGR